jgi:hypothetical protein
MKITDKDQEKIEQLFHDRNVDRDLLNPLIDQIAETDGRMAEKARQALEIMIWFQGRNREFESEHGITIDQACFQLIEEGNYQPVLEHIVAVGQLSLGLPADSQAVRFLNAYIGKYLDAMDAKDEQC